MRATLLVAAGATRKRSRRCPLPCSSFVVLLARGAGVRGTINLNTNVVTLLSDTPATASVTGLAGGQLYGGQSIRSVAFGPAAQAFAVGAVLGQ